MKWKLMCAGAMGIGAMAAFRFARSADVNDRPAATRPAIKEAFRTRLLQIAAEYKKFGRVDDQARLAPLLCRRPVPADFTPSEPRFSASREESTHGRKLYYIFAKARWAYVSLGEPSLQKELKEVKGQVIVKESWTAEPVDSKSANDGLTKQVHDSSGHFLTATERDGKIYKTGKQADLFIMYQAEAKTDETDEGWVYGTVSADLKTVTGAGRMESCMKCHADAPYGRLFGMKLGTTTATTRPATRPSRNLP